MRAVLLLALCILLLAPISACSEPQVVEPTNPEPDIPRYTADQVIAVVKAQYPTCFKRERTGTDTSGMFQYRTVETSTQISVQFIGGSKGVWQVTITCPQSYHLGALLSGVASLAGYFWESDGALHKGYIP